MRVTDEQSILRLPAFFIVRDANTYYFLRQIRVIHK